ncbi:unnamed protein product [Rhizoctonia solani]|uniref:Uncharacterized protein n=1 Tax=Rhizoctonia solani TaxID=456999 RepID=A0A8H2ZWZ6_9AGAM|nr:unnamed protein product [Rhizoctonia solani]
MGDILLRCFVTSSDSYMKVISAAISANRSGDNSDGLDIPLERRDVTQIAIERESGRGSPKAGPDENVPSVDFKGLTVFESSAANVSALVIAGGQNSSPRLN